LVGSGNFEEEEGVVIEVSDYLVVQLLESILLGPYANQVTREYVMTALMKLSSRLSESSAQNKIKELLNEHTVSMEVEIQQRAVEYSNLFSYDSIRPAVLERMPVPEARTIIQTSSTTDSPSVGGRYNSTRAGPSDQDLLLDLMGVGTSGGTSGGNVDSSDIMSQSPVATSSSAPAPQKTSNVDLLADLFGGGSPAPAASSSPAPPAQTSSSLMDLLGGSDNTTTSPAAAISSPSYGGLDSLAGLGQTLPTSPAAAGSMGSSPAMSSPTTQQAGGYEAYTKNGLTIRLLPSKDRANPAIINIQVLFSNNGSQGVISDLQFQAAVPKSQRLQMNAASNNTVQPNTTEKQLMRINNPQNVSVRIASFLVF
jgi:AP-1 complex subunit gamma-1